MDLAKVFWVVVTGPAVKEAWRRAVELLVLVSVSVVSGLIRRNSGRIGTSGRGNGSWVSVKIVGRGPALLRL
jgi:hypothetical protein